MADLLKDLIKPATWFAAIVTFIGVTGLAFNTFLSLLVGARVASNSTAGEHFSAGAGLIVPGLSYVLEIVVAAIILLLLLLFGWLLGIFMLRLLTLLACDFVRWLASRSRNRRLRRYLLRATESLEHRLEFVRKRHLNMTRVSRQAWDWVWEKRKWILNVSFAVFAVIALGVWIPYSEAKRYRNQLCDYALWSVRPPDQTETQGGTETNPGSRTPTATSDQKRVSGGCSVPDPHITSVATAVSALGSKVGGGAGPIKGDDNKAGNAPIAAANLPVLDFLSSAPRRLLGESWAGVGWFVPVVDGGKAVVTSLTGLIPVEELLAKPKLVAVTIGEVKDKKVLRPMLTVAEYSDTLVLYDFLFDNTPDDMLIYPLRTLKQDQIKSITAISPKGQLTQGVTGDRPERPLFAILSAACGRDLQGARVETSAPEGEDQGGESLKEVKEIEVECANRRDFQVCIKERFVDVDFISCEPRKTEPDPFRPLDNTELSGRVEKVAGALGALESEQKRLVVGIDRLASRTETIMGVLETRVGAVEKEVGDLSGMLAQFAPSLVALGVRGMDALSKAAETVGGEPYFLLISPGATEFSRWAKCEALEAWNKENGEGQREGIEFLRASKLLSDSDRHGLVFSHDRDSPPTAAGWVSFMSIAQTWVDATIASRTSRSNQQPVLFLVGQASEDGTNSVNLRLTEERALAVRAAMRKYLRNDLVRAGLLDEKTADTKDEVFWVIAVGEGEGVLAPQELTSGSATRRVDAKLCFVPFAMADEAAKVVRARGASR